MADFVSSCVVVPVVFVFGIRFEQPKSIVMLTEQCTSVIKYDRCVFVIASNIRLTVRAPAILTGQRTCLGAEKHLMHLLWKLCQSEIHLHIRCASYP